MKKLLPLLFFIIMYCKSFGQEYIFGKITSEQNLELSEVLIINVNTDEKTYSDKNGIFMILAKNNDILRIVKNKYDRITYKINSEDFKNSLKIILIKSAIEIKKIELKYKLTGNLNEDIKKIEHKQKTKLNKEISKYIAKKSDPNILKPRGGEFVQPVGEGFFIGGISNQWDSIDLLENILNTLGEDYFIDLGLIKLEIEPFINYVLKDLDVKNSLKYGYLKSSELLKFQQLAEQKIKDFKKLK